MVIDMVVWSEKGERGQERRGGHWEDEGMPGLLS